MKTIIQTTLIISVLSIPIVFFFSFLYSLEKKSKTFIEKYSTKSSTHFRDINVWFKNIDIFRKGNKFSLDPHKTLYDYNTCDLILDNNRLMVIGKMKMFGKLTNLMPTLLTTSDYDQIKSESPRIVFCENVIEVGSDLEIDFKDRAYDNLLTLVIKGTNQEMRDKIKNGLQQGA